MRKEKENMKRKGSVYFKRWKLLVLSMLLAFTLAGCGESTEQSASIDRQASYTSKDEVALYIHTYGELPENYITKKEAKKLGWDSKKGNLEEVAPGKSIGGDHFGNYDESLPQGKGITYQECDIDYKGGHRNAKRIIFSSQGAVYYTEDHYKTFETLYEGDEDGSTN